MVTHQIGDRQETTILATKATPLSPLTVVGILTAVWWSRAALKCKEIENQSSKLFLGPAVCNW